MAQQTNAHSCDDSLQMRCDINAYFLFYRFCYKIIKWFTTIPSVVQNRITVKKAQVMSS
jgi:hypothetical protein